MALWFIKQPQQLLSFTNQMKDLDPINKVVNFPHEPFHEDHFWEANAHIFQLCWKCLKSQALVGEWNRAIKSPTEIYKHLPACH